MACLAQARLYRNNGPYGEVCKVHSVRDGRIRVLMAEEVQEEAEGEGEGEEEKMVVVAVEGEERHALASVWVLYYDDDDLSGQSHARYPAPIASFWKRGIEGW